MSCHAAPCGAFSKSAHNWNERIHEPVPVKLWIRPGGKVTVMIRETAVMRGHALIRFDPWKEIEGSLEPLNTRLAVAGDGPSQKWKPRGLHGDRQL